MAEASNSNEDNVATVDLAREKKDANTCMAIGAGVGALGATGAVVMGAVCPLCYVVAPGLVAIGAYKRWKVSKCADSADRKDGSNPDLEKQQK